MEQEQTFKMLRCVLQFPSELHQMVVGSGGY